MIIDFEHHYLPEELWFGKGGVKGESKIFYERGLPRGNLQQLRVKMEGLIGNSEDGLGGFDRRQRRRPGRSLARVQNME